MSSVATKEYAIVGTGGERLRAEQREAAAVDDALVARGELAVGDDSRS